MPKWSERYDFLDLGGEHVERAMQCTSRWIKPYANLYFLVELETFMSSDRRLGYSGTLFRFRAYRHAVFGGEGEQDWRHKFGSSAFQAGAPERVTLRLALNAS